MVFAGSGQVNGARLNLDGSFKEQDETVSVFVERADITRAGLKVKLADRAHLAVGTGGVRGLSAVMPETGFRAPRDDAGGESRPFLFLPALPFLPDPLWAATARQAPRPSAY